MRERVLKGDDANVRREDSDIRQKADPKTEHLSTFRRKTWKQKQWDALAKAKRGFP